MKTVTLPDGTSLPAMGLGTWYLGENPRTDQAETEALRTGIEGGATVIDTAEMYGGGRSEELVGRAIKPYDRETLFLISKVYPHRAGRKDIFTACEQSLRRLNTDYLDLYLLHWHGSIPFSETVECMEELVRQGKIRRWGVSNLDRSDMEELVRVPDGGNCQANEVLYHLGSRGIEYDLMPWMAKRSMPVIAYCPLAQAGSLQRRLLRSDAVRDVGASHDLSPMQTLLAFVLQRDNLLAIPRSGSTAHVRENLAAAEVTLSPEEMAMLDRAFPPPDGPTWLDIV